MLGLMHHYRQQGEIDTQVMFIVWNFVKSNKDEPMEHNGIALPFTPTKVSLDILDACNKRLYQSAQELDGLFVHGKLPVEEFTKNSTTVLRQLADNVQKPSEELGMPFIHMMEALETSGKKQMNFKSRDVTYDAKDALIQGANTAINAIAEMFEAMVIGDYPSVR